MHVPNKRRIVCLYVDGRQSCQDANNDQNTTRSDSVRQGWTGIQSDEQHDQGANLRRDKGQHKVFLAVESRRAFFFCPPRHLDDLLPAPPAMLHVATFQCPSNAAQLAAHVKWRDPVHARTDLGGPGVAMVENVLAHKQTTRARILVHE